jgi:hypothetical protein
MLNLIIVTFPTTAALTPLAHSKASTKGPGPKLKPSILSQIYNVIKMLSKMNVDDDEI